MRQRGDGKRQTVGFSRLAAKVTIALLTGCAVPVPESQYVEMADGTLLAVDVWRPPDNHNDREPRPLPAVIRFGRYWRDYELPSVFPDFVGKYLGSGTWLNENGYVLVMVDVRGTGASFGVSEAPFSPTEIADFPVVVDWVVSQPWSNGRVAGMGVSYEGVTADWLGASGHPAVRAVLPLYSYSDIYLDVSHPGGLFNERFVRAWGEITAQLDRNSIGFLDVVLAANPNNWLLILADAASALLLGVRPVGGAAELLTDAVRQHEQNPSVFAAAATITFRDDEFASFSTDQLSPLLGPPEPTRAVAMRRVVGWLDAGTARGALRSYNTLDAPQHVLVIAPHTHSGNYLADPYDFGGAVSLNSNAVRSGVWQPVSFFDPFLKGDPPTEPRREVRYYTYVENVWRTTAVWPPQGFATQRWYFSAGGGLKPEAPAGDSGEDEYTVDFNATTGTENRWFSGLAGVPIRYPDRARQDELLLVYQSAPLAETVELTGHPLVSLKVASTHEDGAFLVYLEDVAPDGKVVYLTEGQLRAIHRRISDAAPPAAVFGPYHSFLRADALPLVPGEVAEISFDLLPISTILRAGHRIRVAIAGHDRDTFRRVPAEGVPTLRFQRNAHHASYVELPLKPRPDLDQEQEITDVTRVPASLSLLCPTTGMLMLAGSAAVRLRRSRHA